MARQRACHNPPPGAVRHRACRKRRRRTGSTDMIALTELTKRYGNTLAVDRLTVEVRSGEIFGFLGPNGAGKTTTIRMMMGLLQPTAGRVVLGGYDLARAPIEAKQLCGFVPDRPHLYEKLTGGEFLDFVGGLYHVPAPLVVR